LRQGFDGVLKVLDLKGYCEKTVIFGCFGNCLERFFVFVKENCIVLLIGVFGVQNLVEVESR